MSVLTMSIHWPCYCTAHVHIVVFMIACGLSEWKRICAGFLSFVYICIAVGDPVFKRGSLMFSGWRWEVIVYFVDIGGIVDHNCLIFLCFVDIGRIVDHNCLIFLCFVDIGGIVDHNCLIFLFMLSVDSIFYFLTITRDPNKYLCLQWLLSLDSIYKHLFSPFDL